MQSYKHHFPALCRLFATKKIVPDRTESVQIAIICSSRILESRVVGSSKLQLIDADIAEHVWLRPGGLELLCRNTTK